jgi:hypothetical protein
MGHLIYPREKPVRNAFKILIIKFKKQRFGVLNVDERILLKWTIKK